MFPDGVLELLQYVGYHNEGLNMIVLAKLF